MDPLLHFRWRHQGMPLCRCTGQAVDGLLTDPELDGSRNGEHVTSGSR